MANTLGDLKASIIQWLRGSRVAESQLNDAINDAYDSLFQSLLRASMSVLMGGPTNLAISAAAERTTIVSIVDPAVGPTVSSVAATQVGIVLIHTVRVAITYVTSSGTETLASPVTTYTTTGDDLVASVHAPPIVAEAIGWNCYATNFATSGGLVKQNDDPLDFVNVFIENDSGFSHDPNDPPVPSENTTGDNIFYIRHMEVVTSSNVLKSWNNLDIDSDAMRRLGMTLSSSSDYQNYGYDLINQRQLEIRPALGAALTARYFYIVKPRRMRFDKSPLPYPTVPSEEFVRQKALSDLFLSLREYNASVAWERKSDKARSLCELAVAAMNRPKNQRVTAYRT